MWLEIILMCLMQILKVVYPEYCVRLAHSMYLDVAVINTDLQKNVKIVSTDAGAEPADELTTETNIPVFCLWVVRHGFNALLMAWKSVETPGLPLDCPWGTGPWSRSEAQV